MKEYKVLTQSDSFWRDRFSPGTLEDELNKLAAQGWRLVTSTSTEFTGLGGLGTKRHEMFFILEREREEAPARPPLAFDEAVFDRAKVPIDRFYAAEGNVSTRLTQAGLVTRAQLDRAREEMARAGGGGHLCDYLIGLGYLQPDSLRVVLGKA